MGSFKQMFAFNKDGVWMHAILIMSILCFGLIVERIIAIYFKYNIDSQKLMLEVQKRILADDINGAIKVCNNSPKSALAIVLRTGLGKADRSELEIQNAIEEATLEVVPKVMERLPTMASLANIATLLGLLGTIIGLINAFSALETATADNRQQMLASGISLAMYTTAFGLIVAIPTLIAHTVLSAKARQIIDSIELYSTKLGNLLGSRK